MHSTVTSDKGQYTTQYRNSTNTADVTVYFCARLGYRNFYVLDGDGLLYSNVS